MDDCVVRKVFPPTFITVLATEQHFLYVYTACISVRSTDIVLDRKFQENKLEAIQKAIE